ncbi:hypothetical protein HY969_00715 [Candidatus Kaiserbacteria bacterium]|nr:hypothetical protein [Candidatus Kaiserbacteria bacterium]
MSDFESKREGRLSRSFRGNLTVRDASELKENRIARDLTIELERAYRMVREGVGVGPLNKLVNQLMSKYMRGDEVRAKKIARGTIRIGELWWPPDTIEHVLPDPRAVAMDSVLEKEARDLEAIWETNKERRENATNKIGQDPFRSLLIAVRELMFVEKHLPLYRFDRKKAVRRTRYDPPANLKPSPQDEEAE